MPVKTWPQIFDRMNRLGLGIRQILWPARDRDTLYIRVLQVFLVLPFILGFVTCQSCEASKSCNFFGSCLLAVLSAPEMCADIPVSILPVPAEEEGGPGGSCGGGGHDGQLLPVSLFYCLLPLRLMLKESSHKEDVEQPHCRDAQGPIIMHHLLKHFFNLCVRPAL